MSLSSRKTPLVTRRLTEQECAANKKQPENHRAITWNAALNAKDAEIIGCFEGDNLVGVASYRPKNWTAKLISIASYRHGAGKELVNFIRLAGYKIWCKGVVSASEFYASVGMHKGLPVRVGKMDAHIYADCLCP